MLWYAYLNWRHDVYYRYLKWVTTSFFGRNFLGRLNARFADSRFGRIYYRRITSGFSLSSEACC